MIREVLAVDIGSTFTKGARFLFDGDGSRLIGRARVATTQTDLSLGFFQVAASLLGGALPPRPPIPVRFTSSAKGGLKIAAVGLVPELTLQAARLAACSAGGRVVGDAAFRLGPKALERLIAADPDIVLLTGGTDGGDERHVLENARLLAVSAYRGTLLYAGNASVREEVLALLDAGRSVGVDNVMPDIGVLAIDSARAAIQDIFLRRIVEGRGLAPVIEWCGSEPMPTPAGVFHLVEAMGALGPDWEDFMLLDMGGATTDVYSCTEGYWPDGSVFLKGLHEPRIKRTVEGDLGMRVSAASLLESAAAVLPALAAERGLGAAGLEALDGWVKRIEKKPDLLPAAPAEAVLDGILAEACLKLSVLRHSGRLEEAWTATGRVFLQTGKDLRRICRIIGSGGWLAAGELTPRFGAGDPGRSACIPLLPEAFDYYVDVDYLIPLLGAWAQEKPEEAARCAVKHLSRR